MTDDPSAGAAMTAFATAITERDWDALRALLSEGFTARLLHTGETFDGDGFVALNRDYPGQWRFARDEVVDGGRRAVLRARTMIGDDTWHVASFGSVTPVGQITDLVEVWTEAVQPHPERSPT